MSAAMLELGIDEAGRGPVIGPLVLCGVWLTDAQAGALSDAGVQDSKAFGSSQKARDARAELAALVYRLAAAVEVREAAAAEVDRWVRGDGLNPLERHLARKIIEAGPAADRIVADGRNLFAPLGRRYPRLIAENKADATCTAVAAASVVAKSVRDERFADIAGALGDGLRPVRGGGYPNKATAEVLRRYVEHHGALPPEVRRSWSWPVLRELCPEEEYPLLG